jgi:hypothetical protein
MYATFAELSGVYLRLMPEVCADRLRFPSSGVAVIDFFGRCCCVDLLYLAIALSLPELSTSTSSHATGPFGANDSSACNQSLPFNSISHTAKSDR